MDLQQCGTQRNDKKATNVQSTNRKSARVTLKEIAFETMLIYTYTKYVCEKPNENMFAIPGCAQEKWENAIYFDIHKTPRWHRKKQHQNATKQQTK